MKTSLNDPLRIAEVSPCGAAGVIGLTLCPGKKDRDAGWDRDLDIDVGVIREWGAEVVVSLIETWEFELLEVTDLSSVVEEHGMRWVQLPIVDVSVPNRKFETRWIAAAPICAELFDAAAGFAQFQPLLAASPEVSGG